MPTPTEPTDLSALPVRLAVPPSLRVALEAHVEGELGWQVVVGDELPARLVLRAVSRAARDDATEPAGAIPSILLVVAEDDPAAAAQAGLRADAVVAWPQGRQDLPALARRLLGARAGAHVPAVRIAGSSGGVGTTTVATALGALLAWSGTRSLVIASGPCGVAGAPVLPADTLVGPRPWEAAGPARGCDGLRLVRSDGADAAEVAGCDAVVLDLGTDADRAHVLVVRRDAAGRDALQRSPAGAVVVSDAGVVPLAALHAAAAGRLVTVLPWSARVARAVALGRVPTSLPGSWLQLLAPLAATLRGEIHRTRDGGGQREDAPR